MVIVGSQRKKYYYIAVRKIAVHAPQDGNHNCVI